MDGAEALGAPDVSPLADLAAGCERVTRIEPVPDSKASSAPLLLAALLPIAAVVVTQMPFEQVFGVALKALVLV